jgi:hypothetical protein
MGKKAKVTTRSEEGRREEAEGLHACWNKQLKCPGCGAHDPRHGTFNKDCAGKSDSKGQRYRRFVCRVTPGCRKSIGVTEFLQICTKISPDILHSTPPVLPLECMY